MENTQIFPIEKQKQELDLKKIIFLELTTKYNASFPLLEWCKLFFSLSPDTFQHILDTIEDIVLFGQIEAVDIPNIVLLVITNIQNVSKKYDIVCREHMISLTKILTNIIIDYELFHVCSILKNNMVIEAMINSCIELIQIDLNSMIENKDIVLKPKPKESFWDWLYNIFF
jgi:hypothetical protein